ncbi:hypothetical protein V6U89_17195 [Micromonospora sp. CPCC 206171]|uniref:hypothetical protein n=1 Tax=Micromonospora sp. CPCC 206171 TaxID=3122405 RepID=UPI002FF0069F
MEYEDDGRVQFGAENQGVFVMLLDPTEADPVVQYDGLPVIAVAGPQPGNRNDTIVYRTPGIDPKLDGRPVTDSPGVFILAGEPATALGG